MNRHEAREYAFQKIYEIDVMKGWDAPDIDSMIDSDALKKQEEYVRTVISLTAEHLNDIDGKINIVSDGWTTGRMNKTDLAIIRLASCEILYIEDIPKAVSVNEAVEIAKLYGSEKSPGFINAILAKVDR